MKKTKTSLIKHSAYYLLDDRINGDTAKPLIEFIREHPGDLMIGIDSIGGSAHVAKFLTAILNENSDRITLAAVCGVYSSAFEMFYRFRGKRIMTDGCRGMYHYGAIGCNISENGKPFRGEDKCVKKNVVIEGEFTESIAKDVMNKKEFRRFKNNGDIYFSFNRMREIFPDAMII